MINLLTALVMWYSLSSNTYAGPIDIRSKIVIKSETPQLVERSPKEIAAATDEVNLAINKEKAILPVDSDEDEDLDTASNIVFRPLFVYRQQQAKRKRIIKKPSRRRSESKPQAVYHPYGYFSYGYPYYRPIRKRKTECSEHKFPAL